MNPIKVGISSCLLGQPVRYDGGHKLSVLCAQELTRLFEFVPTCPEAGAGLGVPRPAVRLTGDPAAPRASGVDDPQLDVTDALQAYAEQRVPQLGELCGYVFIRNSPSCGLHEVKVHAANGQVLESGRGIFAAALTRAWPLMPVEEVDRLQDPALRRNFIVRVFAMHHWKQLQRQGLSAAGLHALHSRYKDKLKTHNPQQCEALERILTESSEQDLREFAEPYFAALMVGLGINSRPVTQSK